MSVDLNIVIFGGRLTNDPSVVGTSSGCRFDVACNRTYKTKDGERQEETTYMPVTCWGSLSDLVMKTCKKGDPVIVEGRIEVRKFAGEDGTQHKYVNLVAKDVRFLSSKTSNVDEERPGNNEPEIPGGVDANTAKLLAQLLNGRK